MAAQQKLFELPPRETVKRMHVTDAGSDAVQFRCKRCGFVSKWLRCNEGGTDGAMPVTEAKRGLPCPQCNQPTIPDPSP